MGSIALPALGGLICVASPDSPGLRLLGGLLILAAFGYQLARFAVLARRGMVERFWIGAPTAGVLIVATGLWHVSNRPDQAFGIGASVLLLLVVAWWGRNLRAYTELEAPLVSRIPGVPERPGPVARGYRWWSTYLLATLVVAFVLGLVRAPALVLAAVIVGGVAAMSGVAVPILRSRATHLQITQALTDYAPLVALPYAGRAIFHTAMWAPYVARTGEKYVIVASRHETFHRLAAHSSDPIVAPATTSAADIETAMPRSLRVAFYVQNSVENRDFLSLDRMTHVFVHHGDGDKPASAHGRSVGYDVLVVAGQAAIDRYAQNDVEVPGERFKILGRPQTERIETVDHPISSVENPVVLYAPTWHGPNESQNYCSLEVGKSIVRALLDRELTVIFRRHPAGSDWPEHEGIIADIKKMLAADSSRTGRPHLFGREAAVNLPLHEAINRCDAMVADVSGIVTDYMASLKPFAMVAMKSGSAQEGGTATERFRRIYPTGRSAYVIEKDLSTLHEVLDSMLGPDPLAQIRAERRDYYLGGYENGESAQAFMEYVRGFARDDAHPRAGHDA